MTAWQKGIFKSHDSIRSVIILIGAMAACSFYGEKLDEDLPQLPMVLFSSLTPKGNTHIAGQSQRCTITELFFKKRTANYCFQGEKITFSTFSWLSILCG